jgi:hypothetical protein
VKGAGVASIAKMFCKQDAVYDKTNDMDVDIK